MVSLFWSDGFPASRISRFPRAGDALLRWQAELALGVPCLSTLWQKASAQGMSSITRVVFMFSASGDVEG